MDKNETPQPLAMTIDMSFNDVRQFAAVLGIRDLSDKNIKKMFFQRERPVGVDINRLLPGVELFEIRKVIVSLMIGGIIAEEGNEKLLDEVVKYGVGQESEKSPKSPNDERSVATDSQ